jgi:dihydropyrimidinase
MRDDQLELVVRGGTVVTAEGRRQADVGIAGGKIVRIDDRASGGSGTPPGTRDIDASGRLVLPGGVDPHVHLNIEGTDPGEPRWVDDYMTGSRAALAGGVTTVGNMAFVLPWESIADRVRRETALVVEQAIADVFFHTVIVQPSADILGEVGRAVAGGQSSMKMFMTVPTFEANVPAFTRIMKATADAGGITLVHCEDLPTIECCTTMLAEHAQLGLAHFAHSRPVAAETVATERAIAMCRATGAPTYVVHLSSARALALYVAQPPLREREDQEALWRGLADGSIDTVASDHAPWTRELKLDPKLDITRGRPGVAELDTMLPLLYTEGVTTGRLSLERFVALTATNAAKLFGLYPRKGTIAVGSDADLAIWETRERRIVRDQDMFSRAAHSVYAGRELRGWPQTTIRRGQVVFDGGEILGRPGSGEPIRRGPHNHA